MYFKPLLGRRRFIAAALAPLVPLPVLGAPAPLKVRQALLGTQVDIVVADPRGGDATAEVERAFAEMRRLERLMSRFDAGSQLSLINRRAGSGPAIDIAPELMAVLQDARQRAALTQGAFEPVLGQLTPQADPGARHFDDAFVRRVLRHARSSALELDAEAMCARLHERLARLDLGGVAKLPILAAGLRQLEAAGLRGCLVNGGGDVLASARADGQPWRIGIRDAYQPERLIAVLAAHAGVVASSGDYERFATIDGERVHHVIDPASGRPTRGLHGVALVAEQVGQVNGFGPAAMVAGPAAAMQRLRQWGVTQALLMADDGSVQASAALRERLQPAPGQAEVRGLAS